MSDSSSSDFQTVIQQIRGSGKSIYDPIGEHELHLWLSSSDIEQALNRSLCGMNLSGLPLRTRSKVVKTAVCEALGYPTPSTFKKTQPRFLGQNFDIYTQKSNNLQIWNETPEATRRYAIIRISDDSIITKIRVVDGATLSMLDTTGTLTQKYQARFVLSDVTAELVTSEDTDVVKSLLASDTPPSSFSGAPTELPRRSTLLPIKEIFDRLCPLLGVTFKNAGHDQERNRGADLHKKICLALGYESYKDNGSFPDIRAQVLEVKLQTATTIDLGLVTPSSAERLDFRTIEGDTLRHCDVRYVVFFATAHNGDVQLTHLVVVTGFSFFSRFIRFEGKVLNKKLQIPLPSNFFIE